MHSGQNAAAKDAVESLQVKAAVEEMRSVAPPSVRVTARAVARVLHGRDCPGFPRATWCKCSTWGKCVHVPFLRLRQLAQAELISSL